MQGGKLFAEQEVNLVKAGSHAARLRLQQKKGLKKLK